MKQRIALVTLLAGLACLALLSETGQ